MPDSTFKHTPEAEMHAFAQLKRSMMVLGIAAVPFAFAGTAHAQQPATRTRAAATMKRATVTKPAAASRAVQQPVRKVSGTTKAQPATPATPAKPAVTKMARADAKPAAKHHGKHHKHTTAMKGKKAATKTTRKVEKRADKKSAK